MMVSIDAVFKNFLKLGFNITFLTNVLETFRLKVWLCY